MVWSMDEEILRKQRGVNRRASKLDFCFVFSFFFFFFFWITLRWIVYFYFFYIIIEGITKIIENQIISGLPNTPSNTIRE
jgi:hypothetical protein